MNEKVASAKYNTMIALTRGYWQIPLETGTIEKSAFITTKALYEFLVMPFGMKGLEHPVAYASRKLKPRQEKLSTTEKECLARVWAVELFRYYLFGRKFRLQTNHNPLVWFNRVCNKNRKLLRWSITLQEYDIVV